MLKPEDARKQLDELKARHPKVKPLDRCAGLSPAAAEACLTFMGFDTQGKPFDYWRLNESKNPEVEFLAASPDERRQVFHALFGPLAAHVEDAWQFFQSLPYTQGHARRSFRAPKRPEASHGRRGDWLSSLAQSVRDLPADVLTPTWLASWAVHLHGPDAIGHLLAPIIDQGGDLGNQVFEILKNSSSNQHDIGGMGMHVCRALLCCARSEAWEFTGKLLLAAQRQEGLRQSILQAVDEAHPGAFAHMLKLIREEDLVRFSSVVRAVAVWLGRNFDALTPGKVKDALATVQTLLEGTEARRRALDKGTIEECRTALWCYAFEDVVQLIDLMPALFAHKDPQRRLEILQLLTQTGLPEVMDIVLPLLDDADLRVVKTVLDYFRWIPLYGGAGIETRWKPMGEQEHIVRVKLPADLFERIEAVTARLPEKPTSIKISPDDERPDSLSKATAADLLLTLLGDRSPERLIPHIGAMSSYMQGQAVRTVAAVKPMTPAVRELLLANVQNTNDQLRGAAVDALGKEPLSTAEFTRLEGYLVRKAEKIRLSIFSILMNQPDEQILQSVDRLVQAAEVNQRLAGMELGRQMQVARRQARAIHERIIAYHTSGRRLLKAEIDAIKPLLVPPEEQFTLDDCLSLIDPKDRSPVTPPQKQDVQILSSAGAEILRSLDMLIHQNKHRTFTVEYPNGHKAELVLGSAYWSFPHPTPNLAADEDRKKLPLSDLWEEWWSSRHDGLRDADGLELVRAALYPVKAVREGEEDGIDDEDDDPFAFPYYPTAQDTSIDRLKTMLKELVGVGSVRLRHAGVVRTLLQWLAKLHPVHATSNFVLDMLETIFASIPQELIDELPMLSEQKRPDWRINQPLTSWLGAVEERRNGPGWTPEHDARLFRLLHWLDAPIRGAQRSRPNLDELLAAYRAKACTLADLIDDWTGPVNASVSGHYYYFSGAKHASLTQLTQPKHGGHDEMFAKHPELQEALERCVERVLQVELARGEAPTVATPLANSISALHGAETLFRLLRALGNIGFSRRFADWNGPGDGKSAVLTRMARVTQPLSGDKPKDFAAKAKALIDEGVLSQDLIVELGLLNPYWLNHVEATIGWPGYSEAVWWFIAHTPNPFDLREHEIAEDSHNEAARAWQAIVKARTNLTPEQRYEGVIDVAWFHRAYQALDNAKRWDQIEDAAKFLQRGQSHKRAARLADVLLGVTKRKDLVDGIKKKNLKEYVRLLGLLPLPDNQAKRQSDLQDRYRVLKEYERYAKGLSSMSKDPALRAVQLGMENLAVTAGLTDPMRLEWHVTREYVADLLKGPVIVKIKDIEVSLKLGVLGEADVTQSKNGKPLKAVPPAVKKMPKVAALFERRTDLKRMAASTKLSLEMAMCRGDTFTGRELQELMEHAIVRPLIERLVLQTDGAVGYPVKNGKALEDHRGKTMAIKANDALTIAHPLDLLANKDWHHWQKDCFARERLQPFKQVFREIYVATRTEEDEGDRSRRYAGHQVNPKQALALFGQRGWSTREGIEKLYRDQGIIAEVYFNGGLTTPADVEAPTIELVGFRKRDSWTLLALKKVPKRIFSEVMRDLDLVVSVAHVGGVDPEASASTVEMRTALLRETFSLLAIKNVKLDSRHALIKGKLGAYSVHLGSGGVQKQPGGTVCIVPIHSQHHGRLFLPFTDNDPKTAEVVSKVLLLARDDEIQDPTILQQIASS